MMEKEEKRLQVKYIDKNICLLAAATDCHFTVLVSFFVNRVHKQALVWLDI